MPPNQTVNRSLYEALLKEDDNGNDEESHLKHVSTPRRLIPRTILYLALVVQMLVIVLLFIKLHMASDNDEVYLYSPAEGVVQHEIRSFFFGIGDDLSPFQQPPSPALDQMWQDLYSFGISQISKSEAARLPNKTSVIPGDSDHYITELDVFHQLHCLNKIRQALYPDYYPDMRLGNPKTDEHVNHCVDSIRQSLMCSSDISTIVWQWNEETRNTTFRGSIAHKCRNFDLIREWAQRNMIGREFDQWIHIEDDISIPFYRTDGSTYFL